MANKVFGKKIAVLRREAKLTQQQVADALSISNKSTIASWEAGKSEPCVDVLLRLMNLYNVTDVLETFGYSVNTYRATASDSVEVNLVIKYRACDDKGKKAVEKTLLSEYNRCCSLQDAEAPVNGRKVAELQVYDIAASAGIGNYLNDHEGYQLIEYFEDEIPERADFGIKIEGNSMEPNISDGEVVFVQATPAVDSGEIGIFILNGKSFCKRLNIQNSKQRCVSLVSLNKAYEPIEIGEFDDLRTVGRVISCK